VGSVILVLRVYRSNLSCCTRGPVDRRALLGLAEERVLGVAAPQLLARIVGAVLKETVMLSFIHVACES